MLYWSVVWALETEKKVHRTAPTHAIRKPFSVGILLPVIYEIQFMKMKVLWSDEAKIEPFG